MGIATWEEIQEWIQLMQRNIEVAEQKADEVINSIQKTGDLGKYGSHNG